MIRFINLLPKFRQAIILICLSLEFWGCTTTKQLLESKKSVKIISGKGFGNFLINRSTKGEIIRAIGKGFNDTTYHYPNKQLIYEKYGVAFIYNKDSDTIWNIIFFYPFKGITDHRIVLNRSTMKDVETAYGELWWQIGYPFTHWSSMYRGIEYQVEKEQGEKTFPLVEEHYINKVITKIEVFNNDHFYNSDGNKKLGP